MISVPAMHIGSTLPGCWLVLLDACLVSINGCMPQWCLWELSCTLDQQQVYASQDFAGPSARCDCGCLWCRKRLCLSVSTWCVWHEAISTIAAGTVRHSAQQPLSAAAAAAVDRPVQLCAGGALVDVTPWLMSHCVMSHLACCLHCVMPLMCGSPTGLHGLCHYGAVSFETREGPSGCVLAFGGMSSAGSRSSRLCACFVLYLVPSSCRT